MERQQPVRECPSCGRRVPTRVPTCRCGFQFGVDGSATSSVNATRSAEASPIYNAPMLSAMGRGLKRLLSLIPADNRSTALLLSVGLTLDALGEHWRLAGLRDEMTAASGRREVNARFDGFTRGFDAGQGEYEKRIRPVLLALQVQCNQAAATSQIAEALQWMASIQEADRRDRVWNDIISGR